VKKRELFIMILMMASLTVLLTAVRTSRVADAWLNRDWHGEYAGLKLVPSTLHADFKAEGVTERYLILQDEAEEVSLTLAENLERTILYMKKEVTRMTITGETADIPFASYTAVLFALEDLNRLPDVEAMIRYVSEGGAVLLAERPLDNEAFRVMYRKLGIYEKDVPRQTAGMTLKTDLLIGGTGISILDKFTNNSLPVRLESDCTVHAVSLDGNPMVWSRNSGSGRYVVVNGQFLMEKEQRGIIPGILHALADGPTLYPVLNVSMVHIDDFPAPVPEGNNEWIYPVYRLNTADFFRQVWWPDMLAIASENGYKYTSFVIESYRNDVSGDFSPALFPGSLGSLSVYGRELLRSGGELGIHGFNHQPLLLEGVDEEVLDYSMWPSRDNMIQSLKGADDFVKSIYNRYEVHSYVPPSNVLGQSGREILPQALGGLRVIASEYTGYDYSYLQEFERGKDGVLEMPRFTSDYTDSNENWWYVLNAVSLHGAFIHFVHPDDVLDPDRNYGKTWEQLRETFDSMLGRVRDQFPWLVPVTMSEGAVELERYLDADPQLACSDSLVRGAISGFRDHVWFILRTSRTPVNPVGCTISFLHGESWLVRADKADFEIVLEETP